MAQLAQMAKLEWREPVRRDYADLWTPEAIAACEALAPFNRERLRLMAERIERRRARAQGPRGIQFLSPSTIPPSPQPPAPVFGPASCLASRPFC